MAWSECKERGNRLYQAKNFKDAVKAYTEALEKCTEDEDKTVVLKNRAAAYLKIQDYQSALSDSDAALQVSPRDIKSMYRRSQALEGIGNISEAFKTIKTLLSLDSNNKEALSTARRLVESMRRQSDAQQSTSEKVKSIFASLESGKDNGMKIRAARNFAILSRDSGGRQQLLSEKGLVRLVNLLDCQLDEVVHHILQTFIGLCGAGTDVTRHVLTAISMNTLTQKAKCADSAVSGSAIGVLKTVAVMLSSSTDDNFVVAIVHTMLSLLLANDVAPSSRDVLLEAITTALDQENLRMLFLREGLVDKLLILSATCHTSAPNHPVNPDLPVNSDLQVSTNLQVNPDLQVSADLPMNPDLQVNPNPQDNPDLLVSDDCHMNLCVVFSKLSQYFINDVEMKESVQSQCQSFILKKLRGGEIVSIVSGLSSLSVLLQSTMDMGNDIFNDDIVTEKAIEMAKSDQIVCQEIAAEVFSLAASNKTRCDGILQKGLPTLKQLYSCSTDSVRVRALVGLCRLGSTGGGNVNARTFAEGSTVKLGKMCRKFLISTKKGQRLRKWAIEGLAFLSLDAEVKEAFIADSAAIEMLYSCAKSADRSQLLGIATIFVNLTNSYDKPERNPELEELGKYAGENVPKEHELDGEDYVKKRVAVLMKGGVVSCLILLASLESISICELASRVFLAVCKEINHRGAVIQQGGVKALLSLATSNNTDKGKLFASQALARVGITNDPRLAFQGQRSLEVIRPLVQLLKSDRGLQQFEGLMALTNLAGTSEDVRLRIYREGAVPLMESLMFEEHEMIRRASTEALCNMLSLEQVHERFYSDDVERVKLWTLFSGEEDQKLALAASGGLAQLTHDPKICEKVMEVKSTFEILKELLGSLNSDLQYRSVYILTNLVMANVSIAQKIVESEILEVFMAFAQSSTTSERVKLCVERALAKCVTYGLIKPNQ